MARLKGALNFTGSIGNLSAYNSKGIEDTLIRLKGGASREKIKKAREFTNTRKNNAEFGGASTAGKKIKEAIISVTHLDHSRFQNRLNTICRFIINQDPVNDWGKRSFLLSNHRSLLEGFNLGMGTAFDSIIKHPLACTINRSELSATVLVPQLIPKIGLYVPGNFSFFRLIAVMGIVPDLQYDTRFEKYFPINAAIQSKRADIYTDWLSTADISSQQELNIQIEGDCNMSDQDSVVLAVGVEFGAALSANLIKPVTNAGAAKMVGVA